MGMALCSQKSKLLASTAGPDHSCGTQETVPGCVQGKSISWWNPSKKQNYNRKYIYINETPTNKDCLRLLYKSPTLQAEPFILLDLSGSSFVTKPSLAWGEDCAQGQCCCVHSRQGEMPGLTSWPMWQLRALLWHTLLVEKRTHKQAQNLQVW